MSPKPSVPVSSLFRLASAVLAITAPFSWRLPLRPVCSGCSGGKRGIQGLESKNPGSLAGISFIGA